MDKIDYCSSSESEEEVAAKKPLPSIASSLKDIPVEFSTSKDVKPMPLPKAKEAND